MSFKKMLIFLILFCIFGFSLLGFAWQYKTFYENQMELRKHLLLNNADLALDNLKQTKESWIYKGLSILKPERYYLVNYYQGLANFKIGNFKEAIDGFSKSSLSKDHQLNADSRLAASVSLWLSGKITPKIVRQMLELYADIIVKDPKRKISWTKREAKERAYWIMARRASQRKVKRLVAGEGDGTGEKGEEKKGKALKEEFKRLMKEKPLEKGR